eukprot:CAMPEP_0205941284 /NCGR_PEP_ID=MMETSP1325-20131115/54530_1 /ASSEMBLY_ACC=CAM_ASM_000708 /TAXON_ID=236786 /ORGANISM="Florenciella sp., Strain RCC1007" /LENGTH=44 /DNA_ID= /DNA_START= /DNA_END= /DNA_ORIENTATION=
MAREPPAWTVPNSDIAPDGVALRQDGAANLSMIGIEGLALVVAV